eukprot:TRINITY_DN36661_c0_g2_i1.p1 TRINITY_DN36661_c0_g2~~TRINITY_DN36661_c0_g2_i1.p1  ORF type:complete len:105 (-),score=6.33 TRINITY_DN36661_c0_g2_i1:190-504(-)
MEGLQFHHIPYQEDSSLMPKVDNNPVLQVKASILYSFNCAAHAQDFTFLGTILSAGLEAINYIVCRVLVKPVHLIIPTVLVLHVVSVHVGQRYCWITSTDVQVN